MKLNSSLFFNATLRVLFVTIVLTVVNCNGGVSPSQQQVLAAQHVAEDFFTVMTRSDYKAAAQLFCFPSGKAATNDQEAGVLFRRLATLQRQFGPIASFAASSHVMPYVEVGITAGTVQYWASHPRGLRLTFDVRFGSYRDGFVIIELCRTQGARWRLRAVHYGLPAIDPRSAARVAAAATQL
jgi:hypothetical protein